MPTFPPIMPFILLILILLPVKLQPKQLCTLAFCLWLMGGVVLCALGITRLMMVEHLSTTLLIISLVGSVVIGIAKGRFILGKTSNRNIDRLSQMTEAQRPVNVYGVRSWIVIGLMVLISLALNFGGVPLLWRGVVNLAIGIALIVSSFNYLSNPQAKALQSSSIM